MSKVSTLTKSPLVNCTFLFAYQRYLNQIFSSPKKLLKIQSICQWFQTAWRSRDVTVITILFSFHIRCFISEARAAQPIRARTVTLCSGLLLQRFSEQQGAVSIRKTVLLGMAIPMLKIRRPTGRLIFNMGIPIPGKTVFLIETGPRTRQNDHRWWEYTAHYNRGQSCHQGYGAPVRQMKPSQGLYSLNGRTSYRKIPWSLDAVRLHVMIIGSLWNLTGISATLLSVCLSHFKAIGKI